MPRNGLSTAERLTRIPGGLIKAARYAARILRVHPARDWKFVVAWAVAAIIAIISAAAGIAAWIAFFGFSFD